MLPGNDVLGNPMDFAQTTPVQSAAANCRGLKMRARLYGEALSVPGFVPIPHENDIVVLASSQCARFVSAVNAILGKCQSQFEPQLLKMFAG